ncbi:MAG TPA: imidazole glycerol phosphate synthase subunit HisH [bacterium]|nr:imidazole glycerol phosphate synthase subunit HisH [bacterium]
MREIDLVAVGGNLGSIRRAFERLGVKMRTVLRSCDFSGDRPVVLPGVGAFGATMNSLERTGLSPCIVGAVKAGMPFLGVCVGMQLLFDSSEESPGVRGLGIIPGEVVRFSRGKVPQIGWNMIEPARPGLEAGYAYFVNSFHCVPRDPEAVLYRGNYHGRFCAAVARDNVTAYQFHPEKSMEFGQGLLGRWVDAL